MKIIPVTHGTFKVDGGAMFGPVPKSMWNKVYPADENNLCELTMRSLIVETQDRLILIDTGIGNKHSDKFLSFIYSNLKSIDDVIGEHGYKREDFTDIILTHLHYDHAGGATSKNENGEIEITFPNATYWLSQKQWELIQNPNPREKSALFMDDILPVYKQGKVRLLDKKAQITPEITLLQSNGHTSGMMVPVINYDGKIILFAADLIPTVHNLHLPWVSAYDNMPIVLMEEKRLFLEEAVRSKYVVVFEHDINVPMATVAFDEKRNKFYAAEILKDL